MKLLITTEFANDAPGGGPAIVRQMLEGFSGNTSPHNSIHWWSIYRPSSAQMLDQQHSFSPPFLSKLYPAKRIPHIKAWLLMHIWAPLAAAHLQKTIRTVQPDGIWIIPHNWSIPPLALTLTKHHKKLRFHTSIQDYPDNLEHLKTWGKNICKHLSYQQDELYRLAASRDATSIPMLADLEIRTGVPGVQMLHQGLESDDFNYLRASLLEKQASHAIRIVYAGTIIVMKEFEYFVSLLKFLQNSMALELHFFGAHSYASQSWFQKNWMIEHGNLPERALVQELRNYDWGFIPMALDDSDPRYNRYSFPTKFITYLSAGLPVITLGHPECSVMRMARAWPVGITLECEDPREAFSRLRELGDPTARAKYREGILRCARENFDAIAIRNRLWQCFSDLEKRRP